MQRAALAKEIPDLPSPTSYFYSHGHAFKLQVRMAASGSLFAYCLSGCLTEPSVSSAVLLASNGKAVHVSAAFPLNLLHSGRLRNNGTHLAVHHLRVLLLQVVINTTPPSNTLAPIHHFLPSSMFRASMTISASCASMFRARVIIPASFASAATMQVLDPEDDILDTKTVRGDGGTNAADHSVTTAPIFTRDALDVVGVDILPQRALYGRVISQHAPGFPRTIKDPKVYVNTNAPFSGLVCGVQVGCETSFTRK